MKISKQDILEKAIMELKEESFNKNSKISERITIQRVI
jgi:hypothetical protein